MGPELEALARISGWAPGPKLHTLPIAAFFFAGSLLSTGEVQLERPVHAQGGDTGNTLRSSSQRHRNPLSQGGHRNQNDVKESCVVRQQTCERASSG